MSHTEPPAAPVAPGDGGEAARKPWHRRYANECFECHEPWPCSTVRAAAAPVEAAEGPLPEEEMRRDDLPFTVENERAALRSALAGWEQERDRDPVDYMQGASRAILALREVLSAAAAPVGGRSQDEQERRRHTIAACPTCGAACKAPNTSPDAHRMWAQRHADATGHTALLTVDAVRVYPPRSTR